MGTKNNTDGNNGEPMMTLFFCGWTILLHCV